MQHFKRSELSAALPPPCFVPRTVVYSRPFHRVTHKCNISKGRNCLRHCRRLALCHAPSFIPDRFTVLRINATFQKVGIVCGTAAALLCALHCRLFPTVSVSNAYTLLFKRSEQSAALPPPCFVPRTAVYSRPFHCITHKCNISKGRNYEPRYSA